MGYNLSMEVKRVIPSGYCKGVVNAINIAKKVKEENKNTPVYVLGMIVHNSYVTKQLTELGIITLDDSNKTKEELLDEIDEGIVILTAHGTSDALKNKAISKGLKVVDGTCEDVLKTKNLIIDYLNNDYDVIYFGKLGHPESNAIVSISNRIHLVSDVTDINLLNIKNDKIVVTNQTTMSYIELEHMIDVILAKYPDAEIIKEICNATSSRQLAIRNIKDADALYVVGDVKSNNTNKLVEVAKQSGIRNTHLIANKDEIKKEDLIGKSLVYVTAGASTPPILIDEVIEYLKSIKV